MYRTNKTGTTVFWIALGITMAVWLFRGWGVLTAIPGWVLWILIIATIGIGIVSAIQKTKRW